MREYSYEKRLNKLDLLSLVNRRRRGDLIQMFKYFKGYDKINFHSQPEIIDNKRGYNMKLHDEQLKSNMKNIFSCRIES